MKLLTFSNVVLTLTGTVLSAIPNYSPNVDYGKSVSGFTYSTYLPGSCKGDAQVASELKKISSLTNKIRLYSTDCNQLDQAIKIIKSNNLNINILAGVWVRDGNTRLQNDVNTIKKYLQDNQYKGIINGITVGNEELHNGGNIDNLMGQINNVKQQLGMYKVPIGCSELGDNFMKYPSLAEKSDIIYANIYSFFTTEKDNSMPNAAQCIIDQYQRLVNKYGNKVVISETGWPSEGQGNYRSDASVNNQAQFIEQLVCKAKTNNMSYYVLEAFDSTWKSAGIESHFGILNNNGAFKLGGLNLNKKCY